VKFRSITLIGRHDGNHTNSESVAFAQQSTSLYRGTLDAALQLTPALTSASGWPAVPLLTTATALGARPRAAMSVHGIFPRPARALRLNAPECSAQAVGIVYAVRAPGSNMIRR
jgi:hypothetical protein